MEPTKTMEQVIEKLSETDLSEAQVLLYGREPEILDLPRYEKDNNLEVKGYRLTGAMKEQLRSPRIVRVGLIQNSIAVPTTRPLEEQRQAIFEKIANYVEHAAACKANIICFQEAWSMPFIFPTREKFPWVELAENPDNGPTTTLLSKLAKQFGMVIVSPIWERDLNDGETFWNTAVVIDTDGKVLGKHRKNHIPRLYYNESMYFEDGNLGHPVFETAFGKIGLVICYGRFHPLNWYMQGLNGAEIVFCPAASISGVEESLWNIQGRSAAVANSFYTCNLNRVGTEEHVHPFTLGDGKPAKKAFGHFYGSSYVAAPDGTRTPSLGRTRDGLLITELDLNLCRQAKDIFGFRMTKRLDHYAHGIMAATRRDFKPQIVSKNQTTKYHEIEDITRETLRKTNIGTEE